MVVLQANKFFFEKGGSERYFFMLGDELQKRGHRVVHFSMQHPSNKPSAYSRHFVSERDYHGGIDPAGVAGFIRSREARRNILALIDETAPDVAHLHNIYHQLTPSIIAALRERGVPIVMTLHDYKLLCPNYAMFAHGSYCFRCRGGRFYQAALTRCSGGSLVRSMLLSLEAYWQRLSGVYDAVDLFLAPSRFMRDAFLGAGYASDRIRYLRSFLPESAAHDVGVSDVALPESYMLYFGRLSEEKGLRTLVEAAAATGVPLVLCGEGPQKGALEETARERGVDVRFTGHIDKATLDGVVAGARAVVLPAEWPENAPFTVLEAAAAGVPVIVSDMGGLPEMAALIDGWVFPHGDSGALAAVMETAWKDAAETRARGERARAAVRENWSTEAHMSAVESIYNELMERRSVA